MVGYVVSSSFFLILEWVEIGLDRVVHIVGIRLNLAFESKSSTCSFQRSNPQSLPAIP